jgi:arginyl-tRNA synthetase
VDYSSPNLAKEMHIGHLRSTVIGDTVVRVLEYVGHHAIRVNHVGDWGAQFGSLLAYLEESAQTQQAQTAALADLEKFYQEASARFKSDTQFAAKARQCVVDLQSGDPHLLALWRQFIETSLDHAGAVYELLNITMQRSDVRAESAYNDALHPLVDRLKAEGLLIESDGAQCVFLDEFKGKDGQTLPAIVQKSDGGFPYLATDLAALDYRANTLKGDHLLYVVGAAQSLHLRQAYAVARAGRLIKDEVETRHLPFGLVLKADGTPFKTRDGADVKLIDVLRESVERAATLIRSRNDGATDEEVKTISEVVGIGAIKYAELQKNRTTDYMFDWDTMLAFEGNTAPYLQYAYTRISSLLAKADRPPSDTVTITEEPETLLGLKILQFDEAVLAYLDDYQANVICQYLYELSGRFMSFYEQCPVLSAADDVAASRLRLAQLTADTLRQGLTLLGIETVDRM